jgi:peptide/nickel transport system permease protein
MSVYILRRLLELIPVLLLVSVLAFGLMKLVPGDPARLVAGLDASEDDVRNVRRQLGLDDPLPTQYFRFVVKVLQGDFGRSIRSRQPVIEEIRRRLPVTLELAISSMAIAIAVGVPLGIFAALHRATVWDLAAMVLSLLGISVPVFWLGLLLILIFAVTFRLLPSAGREGPTSVVLPALTLGLTSAAMIARMTRSSMLEVLSQDYVRTARAKGLRELLVLARHALPNALIPIITLIGLQLGGLVGGAVITETVFAWPGLGRLMVDAIKFRDFPVVQSMVLCLTAIVLVVNLLMDIAYALVDPRIRFR